MDTKKLTPTHRPSLDAASTSCLHSRDNLRRARDVGRYMKARVDALQGLLGLLLLSLVPVCIAQDKDRHPDEVLQSLAGVFESDEKFARLPLFTIEFGTNRTYNVKCSQPDRVQGIDGDGHFSYQGTETGTWRWEPQRHELVLTANKASHMACRFPHIFKVPQDGSARLEAVNPPPERPQNGGPLWRPFVSPYFHRKAS